MAILSDFDGEEGISLGLMLMRMGMGGSAFFFAFKKRIHSKLRIKKSSTKPMGLFMSWLFYYLIPMAERHISWGGHRAYDHLCVWEALPSLSLLLLPSRRGFIASAQKSNTNTNIDIINHNIAWSSQSISNHNQQHNTGQEDEVLQHFNLPHGHHLNGGCYLSI